MGTGDGSCEGLSHGSHRRYENSCGTYCHCVQAARKNKEKSGLQQACLAQRLALRRRMK
jgi:hypothetical protein